MISIGTRKPRPIGPRMGGLPTTVGSGTAGAVTYSPGVPGGAVTGGTWSKNPPFSSYVANSTVFAHCAGFDVKADTMADKVLSPNREGAGGCSESSADGITHDTCGRFPASASARKSTGNEGTNAF